MYENVVTANLMIKITPADILGDKATFVSKSRGFVKLGIHEEYLRSGYFHLRFLLPKTSLINFFK